MSASFLKELRRRNVFRVAAMYAVVSWLLLQVGDVVFPALRLPEWSLTMLIAFLAIGLPVALLLAWAYEVTPQGILRTADVPESSSITASTGHRINYLIIVTLAIALAVLLVRIAITELREPVQNTALPVDRSIAVLPFKNLSAGEENAAFFSGGLHDELLTLLSRLGDLRVISRTSVERLDPALSIREIGALLGVATVLEGQVQRAGDQLRINVQLIDTVDEGHLWANTYDSTLTAENVFSLQSEISRTIATALEVSLSDDDEKTLAEMPTRSTEAFEKYLRAVQLSKQGTVEALIQARDYLLDATRLDPGYAEAWAQLAHQYDDLLATGAISESEYVAAAKPAIDTAIRLDPESSSALAELAVYYWRSGREDLARAAFADAIRLGPNDAALKKSYGTFLRTSGDLETSRQILTRAVSTNPLDVELLYELGRVEMYLGFPEQLLMRAERIRELSPSSIAGYAAPAQATGWMGRYDLYWTWLHRALDVDRLDVEIWSQIAAAAEELGESAWADRYARQGEALQTGQPSMLATRVMMHLNRGDFDAALEISRRALDENKDNRWGSEEVFLNTVRDHAIRSGEFEQALHYFRSRLPGLFAEPPSFHEQDVVFADDLALLLRHAGDDEQAAGLLDAALARYKEITPEGVHGIVTGITDVELLALSGRREEALVALRQAVYSGWRRHWPWTLAGQNLVSLRDSDEFRAILAELEADTAAQLETIRALPSLGPYDLRESE